jgi:hypothetical protein
MAFMNTDRKYRNSLYTFIIAVESDKIHYPIKIRKNYANSIYVLNNGIYFHGFIEDINAHFMTEDENPDVTLWTKMDCDKGACLATLLNNLLNHLNCMLINPISINKYIISNSSLGVKKSSIEKYSI